jgi:hypothetical protein
MNAIQGIDIGMLNSLIGEELEAVPGMTVEFAGDFSSVVVRSAEGKELRTIPIKRESQKLLFYICAAGTLGFSAEEMWGEVLDAIISIFRLGFIPKDEEFFELTPLQYEQHYAQTGETTNERLYMVLPKDQTRLAERMDIGVLRETQIHAMEKAERIFNFYCRTYEKTFDDEEDKLGWLTTQFPSRVSVGTKSRRYLIRRIK